MVRYIFFNFDRISQVYVKGMMMIFKQIATFSEALLIIIIIINKK